MWNIYIGLYTNFMDLKLTLWLINRTIENKNKEKKHTFNSVVLIKYSIVNKKRDINLLIMEEKKLIRTISSVSISKIFIKKKVVNDEVVHVNI